MRIALRIEVATEAGAREGVPALLRLLDEHQVKASFCISMGPDFSVYPFSKHLPGWLRNRLPVPYISRKNRESLRAIAKAGHDVGLSSYTLADWLDNAAYRKSAWVNTEVTNAMHDYVDLFKTTPRFYGALGWQINKHLLIEEQKFGFLFASDVRGHHAFLPELQGIHSSCPQIPTTLPTIDELLAQQEINHQNVHQYLYAACQRVLPNGEVFTLTAEREGRLLLDVFEKLLVMWKGGQWEIRPLSELLTQIDLTSLQRHQIGWAATDGSDRFLATQGQVIAE